MNKLTRFSMAALVLGSVLVPAAKGIMYSDRAAWEAAAGTWADVDETQIPTGGTLFSMGSAITLPSGTTISYGADLFGYQVGPNPTDWATWSGGNTPRVLAAFGAYDNVTPTSVDATASAAIWAFGLEMEPNQLAVFSMTLSTGDTITQAVDGSAGAAFFGWAGMPVVAFTMSTDDSFGFAFGRMVEGAGAPPPTVPDGGNLILATGLLWLGLFLIPMRRKASERSDRSAVVVA